jgi:hypothetical protein
VTSEGSKIASEEAALSAEETVLAQTAWFLHDRGDVQTAALLLDVEGIEWSPGNKFGDWMDAYLLVPGWLHDRFTEDALGRIRDVLLSVAERNGLEAQSVYIGTALPDVGPGWRPALQERLTSGSKTNHAARVVNPSPELRCDGFVFDSREEFRVYEALKRAQGALPADSTISIFPLPLGRVGVGNTWTPDFLIVRGGRAGLIEVDGPHHRGRLAADGTRDRHWRNSGFVHIERIMVEETAEDSELDDLVRSFLRRLREH